MGDGGELRSKKAKTRTIIRGRLKIDFSEHWGGPMRNFREKNRPIKPTALSCLFLSFSCLFLPFLVFSCLVFSCLVFSCLFLSFLVFSCLFLSFLFFSCLFFPFLFLSFFFFFLFLPRAILKFFCQTPVIFWLASKTLQPLVVKSVFQRRLFVVVKYSFVASILL